MAGCDQFEIEIERRLHGALGEAEGARLATHLSTCARCRAFEATARATEAGMRGAADEAVRGIDWGLVDRAIAAWRLRSIAGVGAWLVLAAVTAGQAWRHRGEPGMAATALLVPGLLLLGFGGFLAFDAVRRGRAARLAPGAALLEALRDELAWRRRVVRRVLAIFPLLTLFFAWQALTVDAPGRRPVLAAAAAVCVVTWLAVWFVKRPRLAREQAALDGASGTPGA